MLSCLKSAIFEVTILCYEISRPRFYLSKRKELLLKYLKI